MVNAECYYVSMRTYLNKQANMKVPAKIWAADLEPEAEAQITHLASLPFIFSHIAVMPDAHAGKGSTVGTVIATKGAIIPAAIGVDIGCGMAAIKLPFTIERLGGSEQLAKLRHSIERAVPVGRSSNKELSVTASNGMKILKEYTETNHTTVTSEQINKAAFQLGTQGCLEQRLKLYSL